MASRSARRARCLNNGADCSAVSTDLPCLRIYMTNEAGTSRPNIKRNGYVVARWLGIGIGGRESVGHLPISGGEAAENRMKVSTRLS